jgi:hypothetical protein
MWRCPHRNGDPAVLAATAWLLGILLPCFFLLVILFPLGSKSHHFSTIKMEIFEDIRRASNVLPVDKCKR